MTDLREKTRREPDEGYDTETEEWREKLTTAEAEKDD